MKLYYYSLLVFSRVSEIGSNVCNQMPYKKFATDSSSKKSEEMQRFKGQKYEG